ncbi:MAG: TonB-dependent receptor [Chitinophagaceae bacterium]|nr:TonB-dependent receptor [Chitinophagaceae bacterium]
MKKITAIILAIFCSLSLFSQKSDSIRAKELDSVTIISYLRQPTISRLNNIQGTYNFSGKKNEVINLTAVDADITNKTGRQTFAKVPGVFVYDMDGSGNQINIASRGLDPHRGWDYNVRKDGVITNSDMYGYPASHYSMPLESISKIELVRGTGSLQYGAQFGGMLNYISKQGDTTKKFSLESINTVGSYNLLSTFNAIGGKIGRFKYYAYYDKKSRNGYRDTEHSESEAEDVVLSYDFSSNFSARLEYARSVYKYRIPGQMNDSMFNADPRQATRLRNYYSPDIHVPSLKLSWQLSPLTRLEFTSSAILGQRSSVMFDKPITIKDTINALTGDYNNRQVDIDNYHSYTNELRMLKGYSFGAVGGNLVAGIQLMNTDLHRRGLGKGTTGSDYNLTLVEPGWGRDMHFKTNNVAVFAENTLDVSNTLSFNAGFRVEQGETDLSGTIVYYPENEIPVNIKHKFPLFGAGFSFHPFPGLEFYGGWSQAYHPMLFKDLIPSSTFEKVDPNIKDAKGYNIETGARGELGFMKWDISTFIVKYNNRFGTLSQLNDNDEFFTYRTNIGNSTTIGGEIFLEGNWIINNWYAISAFTSTSFMDARYRDAMVKSGNDNIDVDGNKVESAPDIISRNGITFKWRRMSATALYSYVSKSYADALNTEIGPASGAVGAVPSYGLLDINTSFTVFEGIEVKLNINNVTNKQYFTKRPSFYPGPGIWPSEGRSMNMSFVVRI